MQVYKALGVLEELGLVRRAEQEDAAYLFKHVLVQETVYASLLRPHRRTLHLLIGGIYQALYAEQIDYYLLVLAQHYQEAGDNGQAHDFLSRYAERAKQMSAYPEAIEALERALTLLEPEAFAARARLLVREGDIYCRRAEYESANQTLNEALALAERAEDAGVVSTTWSSLARVATQQGDPRRARELGERALEWALACGEKEAIARAHRQLGISYNLAGDNELAMQHLQDALALFREMEDAEGIGSALNSMGVVAREEKDLTRAGEYLEEALAIGQVRGDKYSTGVRLTNLSVIAEQQGDIETAARYQERAHAIAVEIGDREGAALTELNLGSLAQTRGEFDRALDYYQSALRQMMDLQAIPYALYTIAAIAKWDAKMDRFEQAAELLGLATGHAASTADIEIDFADVVEDLGNKLPRERLEAAMERGKGMPLKETAQRLVAGV